MREAANVIAGNAVFDRIQPTGVVRNHPTNRGEIADGNSGCESQPVLFQLGIEIVVDDTRSDDCEPIGWLNRNVVYWERIEHDAASDGYRVALDARSATPRCHRDSVVVTGFKYGRDIPSGFGVNDRIRLVSSVGAFVMAVCFQHLRVGRHATIDIVVVEKAGIMRVFACHRCWFDSGSKSVVCGFESIVESIPWIFCSIEPGDGVGVDELRRE